MKDFEIIVNERVIEAINYILSSNLDMNKASFADSIGIKPAKFSEILNKRMVAGMDIIQKLCTDYNISPNWIITGKGHMVSNSSENIIEISDANGVPLIPIEAIAGLPSIDNIGVSFADCKKYVVPEFEGKGVDYMIRVSGSSMYPKYSNGDILACKYIENVLFLQWGKIYVIDSSQGALVKRVFQDETNPDNLILVSDNKENYPPFSFPKSDIRSLSIVVGVIRLE